MVIRRWHAACLDGAAMDAVTVRHTADSLLCRCGRCTRDRVVLGSLAPRIARVLRLAIAYNR